MLGGVNVTFRFLNPEFVFILYQSTSNSLSILSFMVIEFIVDPIMAVVLIKLLKLFCASKILLLGSLFTLHTALELILNVFVVVNAISQLGYIGTT